MVASVRRSAIRSQLQYLRRNSSHIEKLLDAVSCPPFPLEYKLQRQYWILQLLYHQQKGMYQNKERRCEDRIVSVSQPHVCPIVRGKAGKSTDLKSQVESYKDRFDYLPEAVLADQLYGTRDNRIG